MFKYLINSALDVKNSKRSMPIACGYYSQKIVIHEALWREDVTTVDIDKKLKNCSAGLKAADISGLENWKIRTNMIHETCLEGSCTLPVNRYRKVL